MEHPIEHAVGVYLALVALACLVGIVVKRLTHLPYTIALVLMGLALAVLQFPLDVTEAGFSKDLVFFVLLPPLLFQGALHLQLDRLRRHAAPIAIFATIGVLFTMLIMGGITFGLGVFSELSIALLFGALICTTDPVSVLAIFRKFDVPPDLKYLVEGESLFNDGTGVVVYVIVLEMILNPATGGFGASEAGHALFEFLKVSLGGAAVGLAIGALTYFVLKELTDHLLENAICLLACYGSFWVAERFHLSGVIATVCVGLLLGNYGRKWAMKPKTTETVETFFESIDFLINSLLFIMIGLELRLIEAADLNLHLKTGIAGGIGIGIVAMLVARASSCYPLFFLTRRLGLGEEYPTKWVHILFWGGLRGSIPIALLLGLPHDEETLVGIYRDDLLVVGFGVVCFSLIVQGLTMKPLIAKLKIAAQPQELKEDPAHHQEGLV